MNDEIPADASSLKMKAEEGWQSYVPEIDDLSWYSDKNPTYSGAEPLHSDEAEAARRFVSNWLHDDSHGLRIPGDEWGRTLLNSINVLMAHTGLYETHAELEARAEVQRLADIGKHFMVTLLLDDPELIKAFPKHETPWFVVYTDNGEWARGLPGGWLADDPDGVVRRLALEVHEMSGDFKLPTQEELDGRAPNNNDDELNGTRRVNVLPAGATEDELHELVLARVRAWPGV